jgi:hypothetical protein
MASLVIQCLHGHSGQSPSKESAFIKGAILSLAVHRFLIVRLDQFLT